MAVVGHSMFFKVMMSKPEFWSDAFENEKHYLYGKMPDHNFSHVLKNCEIYPFKL